ncbi:F0F1 ATP synthase subunit A [bacterium]|nr:F0F1 ATP synthase subunit A [bacterium]
MDAHILQGHTWNLEAYGLYGPFWTIQIDTVIGTWAALGCIVAFCVFAHSVLSRPKSIAHYFMLQYMAFFTDLFKQSMGAAPVEHVAFIGSLFTYIFLCNSISIVPWIEEPTKDINTTLALGLISFFYVQGNAIRVQKLDYIKHFFEPFFIMAPIHVVGKLTSIISLSFRLFGNIFGGFIITHLFKQFLSSHWILQTFGTVSGLHLGLTLIFALAEGAIQAFVFAMLTLTYISLEIAHVYSKEKGVEH